MKYVTRVTLPLFTTILIVACNSDDDSGVTELPRLVEMTRVIDEGSTFITEYRSDERGRVLQVAETRISIGRDSTGAPTDSLYFGEITAFTYESDRFTSSELTVYQFSPVLARSVAEIPVDPTVSTWSYRSSVSAYEGDNPSRIQEFSESGTLRQTTEFGYNDAGLVDTETTLDSGAEVAQVRSFLYTAERDIYATLTQQPASPYDGADFYEYDTDLVDPEATLTWPAHQPRSRHLLSVANGSRVLDRDRLTVDGRLVTAESGSSQSFTYRYE